MLDEIKYVPIIDQKQGFSCARSRMPGDDGQWADEKGFCRASAITAKLRSEVNDEAAFDAYYAPAADLIGRSVSEREEDFEDFLTLPAYRLLSTEMVSE